MAVKRNFFNKMNLRGVVCDCKAGENFKGISGLFEFLNRDPNSKSIIQKVGTRIREVLKRHLFYVKMYFLFSIISDLVMLCCKQVARSFFYSFVKIISLE